MNSSLSAPGTRKPHTACVFHPNFSILKKVSLGCIFSTIFQLKIYQFNFPSIIFVTDAHFFHQVSELKYFTPTFPLPYFSLVFWFWIIISYTSFLVTLFSPDDRFFHTFSEPELSTSNFGYNHFLLIIEILSIVDNYLVDSFSAWNYRFFFNSRSKTIGLSIVSSKVAHLQLKWESYFLGWTREKIWFIWKMLQTKV